MESIQNNLHFHFYILTYKLHLRIYKHSLSVSSRAETNTKPANYATQVFSLHPSYQDLSSFPGWRKWAGDRPSLERVRIGIMMMKVKALVTQWCLTLCDPMDCSLPGFSVHGILQARILEWAAIPFSRGSSQPRVQTRISCVAGGFFTV